MLSGDIPLFPPDWKNPFAVHTDASDKQLCPGKIKNNNPLVFLYTSTRKSQNNYTNLTK